MQNSEDADRSLGEFLQAIQSNYEHIKLADQKALVFVTLDGAFVGVLHRMGILSSSTDWILVLAYAAILGLLVGLGMGLLTIWPRRSAHGNVPGLIDPARIAAFETVDAYLDYASGLSRKNLEKEVLTRVFDLGRIDREKYVWLRRSIVVSAGAGMLALAVIAANAL